MKIRHKLSGVVLEGSFTDVADCSLLPPFKFYELADGSRFSKASWEEVKPVWKDVTNGLSCISLGKLVRDHWGDDWRIRKIEYANRLTDPTHAFIIEQRQA